MNVETKNSGLEQSLADLHREALFLSRSTLSDLKDIGQGKTHPTLMVNILLYQRVHAHDCTMTIVIIGQYGKVYKGLYRKSQGPGYPVAVKTIKQYESEKEKDETP